MTDSGSIGFRLPFRVRSFLVWTIHEIIFMGRGQRGHRDRKRRLGVCIGYGADDKIFARSRRFCTPQPRFLISLPRAEERWLWWWGKILNDTEVGSGILGAVHSKSDCNAESTTNEHNFVFVFFSTLYSRDRLNRRHTLCVLLVATTTPRKEG